MKENLFKRVSFLRGLLSLFFLVAITGNVWGEEVEIYTNTGVAGTNNGITATGNVNTNDSNGNPGSSFANTTANNTTFSFTGFDVSSYANLKLVIDVNFTYPYTVTTYPSVTVEAYKNNNKVFTDNTSIVVSSKVLGYNTYTVNITEDFDKIVLICIPGTGTTKKGAQTTTYGTYMDNIKVLGSQNATVTTLSSIAVQTPPSKVEYMAGERFNPAGLVITKTMSDASTVDVAYSGNESDFIFEPSLTTALTTSNTSVTITYGGKSTTQTITVNAAQVATPLTSPTNLSASAITQTSATLSWNAVEHASSYTLKLNGTEITNVTSPYSATGLTANTEYTWSVKAIGDGTNYTSSDYANNETFNTLEEQGGGSDGDKTTYIKVTENQTDWSGEYLIVCEEQNKIFDGSLTTLDATHNVQNVTISNNSISADSKYSFTISKKNDNYLIKSASGYYIGNTTEKNGLSTSTDYNYINSISMSNGDIELTAKDNSTPTYLRFNTANDQDRFRFYTSNQHAISLYKKEDAAPKSLAISGTPTNTTYYDGDTFDTTGLTVTGTFDDNTTGDITSGITWNVIPDPLTAGTTSVRVTATVGSVTSPELTVNDITVNAIEATSIAVKTAPNKTNYIVGETFAPLGLVITKTNNNGSTQDIAYSDANASDFLFEPSLSTLLTKTDTKVTITYEGKSVDQEIIVKDQHKASFYANGAMIKEYNVTEDEPIIFPSNPTVDDEEFGFVGWATTEINGVQSAKPDLVVPAEEKMGSADIVYYAVFGRLDNSAFQYELVNTLTNNETYVFVSSNTVGEAVVLNTDRLTQTASGTVEGTNVSITEYDTKKIISTIDLAWEFFFDGDNFKIVKSASNEYLRIDGSGFSRQTSSYKAFWDDNKGLYGTSNSGAKYYVYRNSNNFAIDKNASSRVYAYKKTLSDNAYTDFCTTVVSRVLVSINVKTNPTKTEYKEGEKLDLSGLVLTAKYNNGDEVDIYNGYTSNPANGTVLNTLGDNTVTITYKEKTCSLTVTVTEIPSHMVTFFVNGTTTSGSAKEGSKITFPSVSSIGEYSFEGWITEAIEGRQNNAPDEYVDVDNEIMGSDDVVYYAVFARENHNSKEYSFSLTPDDFANAGYTANDGSHSVTAEATATDDDSRMTVAYSTLNVMQNSANRTIQFKSSSGCLYNTTDLGEITSVTIDGGTNLNTYYGTSEHPTLGTNDGTKGFFTIKAGSSTGTANKITVVYSVGGGLTDFCTTITEDDALFTVTFSTPYGTSTVKQNEVGEYVTPPLVESVGEYSYYGWSKTEKPIADTVVPSCVSLTNGKYKPSMDITLYAMYKRTESYEGENHTYVISKDNNEIPTSYTDTSISVGGVNFILHRILRNASNYIQTGDNEGYIYSEELPSVIKKITINYQNFTGANHRNTLYVGNSEHPTSLKNYTFSDVDNVVTYEINGGYKYFTLVNEENNANRISDITIECGSRDINFYTTSPIDNSRWHDLAIVGNFPNSGFATETEPVKPIYLMTKDLGGEKFSGTIDATSWDNGTNYGFKLYNVENGIETYWGNGQSISFADSPMVSFNEGFVGGVGNEMHWMHNSDYPSYYIVAEWNAEYSYWHVDVFGIPEGDYLPGSWNNWLPYEQSVKFDEHGILVRSLAANSDYEFKLFNSTHSKWHKEASSTEQNSRHISESTLDMEFTEEEKPINCKLTTTDAGEYLFFIDKEGDTPYISVVYPSDLAVYKGSKKREIIKCNDWAATQTASKNAIALASPAKKSWAEESTRTNVVVLNADRYTCSKFELTDKENFYTPFDFTSKSMAYSRAQSSNMWGTICLPFAPSAEGVTYYSLVGVPEENDGYGVLTFEKINNPEANTPYVYKMASADSSYKEESSNDLTILAVPEDLDLPTITGWTLKGVYEKTSVFETEEAMNNVNTTNTKVLDPYAFYIKSDKFYKINNNFSIGAFRAYFSATETAAKCASFSLTEQDTDAIRTFTNPDDEIEGYYNVNGIEMNDVQRGLNIIRFKSGKSVKIMIK